MQCLRRRVARARALAHRAARSQLLHSHAGAPPRGTPPVGPPRGTTHAATERLRGRLLRAVQCLRRRVARARALAHRAAHSQQLHSHAGTHLVGAPVVPPAGVPLMFTCHRAPSGRCPAVGGGAWQPFAPAPVRRNSPPRCVFLQWAEGRLPVAACAFCGPAGLGGRVGRGPATPSSPAPSPCGGHVARRPRPHPSVRR